MLKTPADRFAPRATRGSRLLCTTIEQRSPKKAAAGVKPAALEVWLKF
jgi:hypothetical protein